GVKVGGQYLQQSPLVSASFTQRGNIAPADLGRFNFSHRDIDKYVFKVPSLRNVALTAPYFHDGSAPTLEAAVEVMFKYQLGRSAPPEDKGLIVKFLKTHTGERQASLARHAPVPAPSAPGSAA